MKIKLNAARVMALAHARGIGGPGELASRLGVHRSTVSRWLSATAPALPGAAAQAVALAALLDVDPTVLFESSRRDFPRLATAVHRAVKTGDWESFHPVLGFLGPYFAPDEEWPPKAVAAAFRRGWHTVDLPVAPLSQGVGYAELELVDRSPNPGPPGSPQPPRVWHLAFRDTTCAVVQSWRPYGGLLRAEGRLRLISYRGFVMRDRREGGRTRPVAQEQRLRVQVWIGAQAGVVRVACLHPFAARWLPEGHSAPDASGEAPAHTFRFCEQGFACQGVDGVRCPFALRCDAAEPAEVAAARLGRPIAGPSRD